MIYELKNNKMPFIGFSVSCFSDEKLEEQKMVTEVIQERDRKRMT